MRGPLAPDLPREITIFAEDLTWLAKKIDAIFAYWRAKEGREEALDPEAVRLLEEVLAPTFELRQPLGALLRDEDRQIIRLTEQQFTVLNGLKRNRRVAISGGAGTGKTVLAIEKAKRLATEGYRTLLTCFNRPLAEYLQGSASQVENLTIVNFQRLCDELAQKAGIDGQARQSEVQLQTFFDDVLPEACERRCRTPPSCRRYPPPCAV
jgi:hypothetical protein